MDVGLRRQTRIGCLLVTGCLLLPSLASAQASPPRLPPQTLTLEEALQYALEHYPAIRNALEQVNASSATVDEARAAYRPRFDAVWQTNRGTANNVAGQLLPQSVIPALSGPVLGSATAESVWGSAVGGLLSWEPFDLGLRSSTVEEAEAGLGRARSQDALTHLAVQGAVGSAFLSLVSAEQAVSAAEADVRRRDVLARAAHVLVDNLLRPGAEASRADAERAAAQTRAIQARQAMLLARSNLTHLLGLGSGTVAVDASTLLTALPAPEAAAQPLADHPVVRAAQASVDLSRAREAILQKTDRPRFLFQSALFARGSGANADGKFDTGANGLWPERANWSAGLQVVFPNLFDGASLKARRAAAAATTRAEDARRDETVLAVTAEQQAADVMVETTLAIAQNTPVQLAAARQSEAQARARYEAGLASIVEVAESQNLLAGAEYQDALARIDVWRALLTRAVAQGAVAPFIEDLHASGAH
jgi:outer membrane protein